MYTLGIDLGSSSVKVSVFDLQAGKSVGSGQYPPTEMPIEAPQAGWAEQSPETWWQHFKTAAALAFQQAQVDPKQVAAIGISYQMHGLVTVDAQQAVIRPAIIWCDSRAVGIGELALAKLGAQYCMHNLLNSPGNFTASKLRWVKEHEPEHFARVHKFMLPGDYLAFRLSGEVNTTASGLSEGVFWNFDTAKVSERLLAYYDLPPDLVPDLVPTFGEQAQVSAAVAAELGLPAGTPITYRAGDQPNNAFSLNVLNPGEVAATAGTSGVIYAVSDQNVADPQSRINTFLHVNDRAGQARNGLLLCVNGTGSLNRWIRDHMAPPGTSYEHMNQQATTVDIGADGLQFYPFGNGAERLLANEDIGASLSGLDFNRHGGPHLYRAGQEGIVFALKYGFDLLHDLGVNSRRIRAGKANMFLSPLFREAFVNTVGARLELYDTDGAEGAARGAAVGLGHVSESQAFEKLQCLEMVEPKADLARRYEDAYLTWKAGLDRRLKRAAPAEGNQNG